MSPWVCALVDHKRSQNMVQTSVTYLAAPLLDIICNLSLKLEMHSDMEYSIPTLKFASSYSFSPNPLHPNIIIIIHILLTVLCTFPRF